MRICFLTELFRPTRWFSEVSRNAPSSRLRASMTHWGLAEARAYAEANKGELGATDCRAAANQAQKFFRKSFTKDDGGSVINGVDLTHTQTIDLPKFILSGKVQHGDWHTGGENVARSIVSAFPILRCVVAAF